VSLSPVGRHDASLRRLDSFRADQDRKKNDDSTPTRPPGV
jgi:hypothetical protein